MSAAEELALSTSATRRNRPRSPYLPEQPKEHISVEGPFVGLVHDDSTVVVQVSLPEGLPEQDPVSHVFDQGVFRSAVFKTNGVTHLEVRDTAQSSCYSLLAPAHRGPA